MTEKKILNSFRTRMKEKSGGKSGLASFKLFLASKSHLPSIFQERSDLHLSWHLYDQRPEHPT